MGSEIFDLPLRTHSRVFGTAYGRALFRGLFLSSTWSDSQVLGSGNGEEAPPQAVSIPLCTGFQVYGALERGEGKNFGMGCPNRPRAATGGNPRLGMGRHAVRTNNPAGLMDIYRMGESSAIHPPHCAFGGSCGYLA